MVGAAYAKSRHVIEKKISPVLDRERDDDVGPGSREPKPEFAIILEKVISLLLGAASVQAVIPGAWLAAQAKTIGMITPNLSVPLRNLHWKLCAVM